MLIDFDKLVSTTHDTVNNLSRYKNGGDALLLYFRYIQQRKMQDTNITYSTDTFMIEAMGWGKEKFYKVKKILVELRFIEAIKRTDAQGKVIGHYVKVNFVIDNEQLDAEKTTLLKNQTLEKPDSGKSNTNASVKNINASVKNINAYAQGNKKIIDDYLKKFQEGTTRYLFFSFLSRHTEFIHTEIKTTELESIERKINEFREHLGDAVAKLELESFIDHHEKEHTIFKSTIGRLNTWLSNKIKPGKKIQ